MSNNTQTGAPEDNNNDANGAANEPSLPLFFKNPVPLSLDNHAKAGLSPTADLSYTRTTNSILINAAEFYEASKHYPIVFTPSELPLPAVVIGLEKQNYFLDENGEWLDGAYIPAYIRRYPFIFMEVEEKENLLLCIDEAAPQFRATLDDNTLPFYDGEETSELTQKALDFCSLYQEHHALTEAFCREIQKHDLLISTRSDAKLFNDREIHMAGFLAVDEKKMEELSDDVILDFYKKGYLPLLYAALMSSSNWNKLVELAGRIEQANNK